jgi:hypothetical protein
MRTVLIASFCSALIFSGTILLTEGPSQSQVGPSARVPAKWGYIDERGVPVIAGQFDDAADFSEGLARVALGACRDNDS